MRTSLKTLTAAVVALTAAAAPGLAGTDQLAAGAGLSPEQAAGLTLTEIAAAKFSRESHDGAQQPAGRSSAAQITRSVGYGPDRGQLAASAGLSADEAQSLSLAEIAQARFDRDTQN